jgi:Calcineurin-like phosphoesterase
MKTRLMPLLASILLSVVTIVAAENPRGNTWSFTVSGDSRNCGDLVMPTIAQDAAQHASAFYWHLGDFRALYKFDEDILGQPDPKTAKPRTTMYITDYDKLAWDDFIEHQVSPFERLNIPVFLGIGNHELVAPKTRADYLAQFADWLDTPVLQAQRLNDNRQDHRLKTHYHWQKGGVDFINLDNASDDQFDSEQVEWFKVVLGNDVKSPSVHTIVLGMHKALPDSISQSHSMSESARGIESGREVYELLLKAQNQGHKRIYILASHSHFFMENIYNTPYWQSHGGVLPGWIVGTAGAVRYRLPDGATPGAKTDVYGYLLATVKPDGEINFGFQELGRNKLPSQVASEFASQVVDFCFSQNSDNKPALDLCSQCVGTHP